MSDEDTNNWWGFDKATKKFTYQKTEDYIFAPYRDGGKRIGDMTREELIHVIATGYYDRERLAQALLHVVANDGQSTVDISGILHTASLIAKRAEA